MAPLGSSQPPEMSAIPAQKKADVRLFGRPGFPRFRAFAPPACQAHIHRHTVLQCAPTHGEISIQLMPVPKSTIAYRRWSCNSSGFDARAFLISMHSTDHTVAKTQHYLWLG